MLRKVFFSLELKCKIEESKLSEVEKYLQLNLKSTDFKIISKGQEIKIEFYMPDGLDFNLQLLDRLIVYLRDITVGTGFK